MKYLFSFTLAVMACVAIHAQSTVLFTENFDSPSGPDSVTTGRAGSSGNLWNDTTFLSTTGSHSYHVQGSAPGSQVYFQTQSFSTVGNPIVQLTFDHIGKVFLANQLRILVSTDGGTTFDTLDGQNYYGSSPYFDQMGYFSSGSYLGSGKDPWQSSTFNATPDSSWWRTEVFDLTGAASDTSGTSIVGYPNVVVRFVANFDFSPPSGFSAGWFVDNIKIEGGSCDFTPPHIEIPDTLRGPTCIGNDTGSVHLRSIYYFEVKAHDILGRYYSGIDSVTLFYSINGAPFHGAKMSSISVHSAYIYHLNGLNAGDTLRYYFEAEDHGCSPTARFPASHSTYREFIINSPISQKCPSSGCLNPLLISNFPWTEDFEGPEWQEVANGSPSAVVRGDLPVFPNGHYSMAPGLLDPYGWSLKSGPTPTQHTGPASGAQPGVTGGGKYLYTEFSGHWGLAAATFITPCIDLRDPVARTFSFYYHMFGADINRLRIDIDTGSTTADFHNSYGSIRGQQQVNSADGWKQAHLDLSPFMGQIIRIRFAVVASNATLDEQDIAIDRLEIRNTPGHDLEVTELITDVNSPCLDTSNLPLQVAVTNLGEASVDSIPLAYQLNNGPIQRDTLFGASLTTADSLIFTFSQLLSFDGSTTNSLQIWAELGADGVAANDSLSITLNPRAAGSISGPTYYEGFESTTLPNWTVTGDWTRTAYTNNDNYMGPNTENTRSGHYFMATQNSSRLESVCIDPASMNNPVFSFSYIADAVELVALIKPQGQPWQVLGTHTTYTGLEAPKTRMHFQEYDLSSYTGTFLLALEVNQLSSSGTGMAVLDHLQISGQNATDLSLIDVSKTISKLLEGDRVIPNVWFEAGLTGTGNVSYSFNLMYENLCKTAPPITASANFTVSSNGSPSHPGIGMMLSDSVEAGRYLVKAWIETSADVHPANDTITMQAVVAPYIELPYFQDFDQCQHDFRQGGPINQWEVRNPVNLTPYSGSRAAVLNNFSSLNTIDNLIPPLVRIDEPLYGVELRFYHTYDFNFGGYGEVQIYTPTGWKNLADRDPSAGTNFTTQFIGTQGWHQSTYPITEFNQPGTYNLRFVAVAEETNGWAIDDFEFYVPEQHSAAPQSNLRLGGLIPRQGNNQLDFTVKNTGAAPLREVTATLKLNGTTQFTETFTFSAIQEGGQVNLSFSQPLVINQQINELQIITSLPNAESDELPADDTLTMNLNLLPHFENLPQCLDFEQQNELMGIDGNTNSISDLWKWTTPSKTRISSAHSGTKALVTGDSTYGPLEDQFLFSPSYSIDAHQCYRFSFWHSYNTEYNFDGGNVEFSLDNGSSWEILGDYEDSTWYNTSYVQALDAIYPGFSGNSNGWRQASQDFHSPYADTIQFRFRFASGATMHGEGWAIDDICFEVLQGSCEAIELPENDLLSNEVQLYPNPAGNEIHLLFSPGMQALGTEISLGIYTQSGQLVKQWLQPTGLNEAASIDISMLPPGLYLLKNIAGGKSEPQLMKRFVKQ